MKKQTTIKEIELLSTEVDNLIKEVKASMTRFISKENKFFAKWKKKN